MKYYKMYYSVKYNKKVSICNTLRVLQVAKKFKNERKYIMAIIIDGKALAKKIREKLKVECDGLKTNKIIPKLAVIMVGDNSASKVYVKNKSKACEEIGIKYEEYLLSENIKQEELIDLIIS